MSDKWAHLLLASCSLALSSCSSDAPAEPEPVFDQSGAFVAIDPDDEPISLYRTLAPWVTESGTFLFVTVYNVEPASYEEAGEISKAHDIPIREPVGIVKRDDVVSLPHRVVWFRTLTREEEDRIP